MVGSVDDIRVVLEATTVKELVECLWAKFNVTSALCCARGIPWVDVWAAL